MKKKRNVQSLYPDYLAFPAMAIFVVFFVIPVVIAFFLGFTDWNINRFSSPVFTGFSNFSYLFQDEYFIISLKNTFIFAFFTAFFKIFFGLFLALAVNRNLFLKNILRTVFYLPAVLSMVVIGIIFSAIFRFDGVVNQFLGAVGLEALQQDWIGGAKTALGTTIVAEVWRWSGFNMAVFLAGLQSIPKDYYESATIDGANAVRRFFSITLPLLIPAFTVNVTFNTIGGLKVFEQVFVITAGGPGFSSQVFGTYIYNAFAQGLLGRSTAMGLILFCIISVTSLCLNGFLKKKEVEL